MNQHLSPTDANGAHALPPGDASAPLLELEPTSRPCDFCGQPFEPRTGGGGKPQRFCSTKCRTDHSNASRATGQQINAVDALGKPEPGTLEYYKANCEALTKVVAAFAAKPTAAKIADDPDRFDWGADDSVVLTDQPATAIYHNTVGQIVIRQEGGPYDDDQVVRISPANLQAFVDKLCDFAGIGSAGKR